MDQRERNIVRAGYVRELLGSGAADAAKSN
jgi:hypothetical protein